MLTQTERVYLAYIETVYFTDTGDNGQPPADAELTELFKAQAWRDCANFYAAVRGMPWKLSDEVTDEQLGHDLWFTRNGHGVGFWDRPKLYGAAKADVLTAMAQAMGEHDSEWVEEGETK